MAMQADNDRQLAPVSAEEAASFRWGGTRARPRKKIEANWLKEQTYLKPPGSCKTKFPSQGISVEVECCEKCNIYVLDPCDQVQIADCVDCRIVVGPCVGSVFLLDCKRCTFSIAAVQLRLRDVYDSTLSVFAPTDECVVLEASDRLQIGAWDVAYPGLAAQFGTAKWAPGAHNFCDRIYDFSPPEAGQQPHWTKLAAHADGRWCELKLSPEGLCGGTVVETRSAAPTVAGCECPCAASDGVTYDAPWPASPIFFVRKFFR